MKWILNAAINKQMAIENELMECRNKMRMQFLNGRESKMKNGMKKNMRIKSKKEKQNKINKQESKMKKGML